MTAQAQPFQSLLSSYLNNEVDEKNWRRFSAVCDLPTIFSDERDAFASYVHDSILSRESLYLPKACEAEALLEDVRIDVLGNVVGY